MTHSECRQSAQGDVVVFVAWCRRAVPCVRSSVTFVYSVKTNKHIFKFFSSSAISKLNVMAVLLRGPNNWGKNRDFSLTAGPSSVINISMVEYASSVSSDQQMPPRHASVNLVYHGKARRYAKDNRTEFNFIANLRCSTQCDDVTTVQYKSVFTGKSETEVT